ncbi:unnamed protein product [Gongylonema pulchrum]|uniref:VASP_tetra domain-containing protein n=1 Tax=Gongylonema pulchrum TaxID=637853 RepID=A0A183DF22_9BILA|nr:unnamed protein product [Gongylonema pulchrum]
MWKVFTKRCKSIRLELERAIADENTSQCCLGVETAKHCEASAERTDQPSALCKSHSTSELLPTTSNNAIPENYQNGECLLTQQKYDSEIGNAEAQNEATSALNLALNGSLDPATEPTAKTKAPATVATEGTAMITEQLSQSSSSVPKNPGFTTSSPFKAGPSIASYSSVAAVQPKLNDLTTHSPPPEKSSQQQQASPSQASSPQSNRPVVALTPAEKRIVDEIMRDSLQEFVEVKFIESVN